MDTEFVRQQFWKAVGLKRHPARPVLSGGTPAPTAPAAPECGAVCFKLRETVKQILEIKRE